MSERNVNVLTSLQAIAKKASERPEYRFRDLFRLLNEEMLKDSWRYLRKNKNGQAGRHDDPHGFSSREIASKRRAPGGGGEISAIIRGMGHTARRKDDPARTTAQKRCGLRQGNETTPQPIPTHRQAGPARQRRPRPYRTRQAPSPRPTDNGSGS